MAITSARLSPSLPWKRAAPETPLLAGEERLRRGGAGMAVVADRAGRKRPGRIVVPEVPRNVGVFDGERVDLGEEEVAVEDEGWWVVSRRGRRRKVTEDGHGVIAGINGDPKQAYFAVFDGHGGRAAVDFVSDNLGKNIIAALGVEEDAKEETPPEEAIRRGYLITDKEFLSKGVGSGACAATVLLKDGQLHAANVGDCRAVVCCKNGAASALTSDHRAGREDEKKRIESTGGYVSCHNGVWRVHGSLSVSRAIGDSNMKDWIISDPAISSLRLTTDLDFLILASDGLWDNVGIQEAVDIVLRQKNSIKACRSLVDLSSSRGSRDDITVMVVDLQQFV